jgi:hypothetical protein
MSDDFKAWTQQCKSCYARIIWARTEKGVATPVDEKPTANGHLVLEIEDPRDAPIARRVGRKTGVPRYTTHFATCPNANDHRRKKAEA